MTSYKRTELSKKWCGWIVEIFLVVIMNVQSCQWTLLIKTESTAIILNFSNIVLCWHAYILSNARSRSVHADLGHRHFSSMYIYTALHTYTICRNLCMSHTVWLWLEYSPLLLINIHRTEDSPAIRDATGSCWSHVVMLEFPQQLWSERSVEELRWCCKRMEEGTPIDWTVANS